MNIILGAGLSGLAAGMKTKWPIYEASSHSGGICNTYFIKYYEFSTGGGHGVFVGVGCN